MPTFENYLEHWKQRYGLNAIEASYGEENDINVVFKLSSKNMALLSSYEYSDYERFKGQAESYARGRTQISYPKLKVYQIVNGSLIVSGSMEVINAFLELLFNPDLNE